MSIQLSAFDALMSARMPMSGTPVLRRIIGKLVPNRQKSHPRIGCGKVFGTGTAQRQSPPTESGARFEFDWNQTNSQSCWLLSNHMPVFNQGTATKNAWLVISVAGESQDLFQFYSIFLRITVWASALQLHLPVQIQMISFKEVIINFRSILLNRKIATS